MSERTYGIGIDLGTSNSSICRADISSGRYEFDEALDHSGHREIPSAAFVDTDRKMLFGQVAQQRQNSVHEAPRVITNFKLVLRENRSIAVPDVGEVEPTTLVRGFLAHLKACYERSFHDTCHRAVITVPAHADFDVDYVERLRAAVLGSAGEAPLFESFNTLHEPDAVLLSLVDLAPFDGRTVLVFDMGGGSLDVSIRTVEMQDDRPYLHHRAVLGSDDAGVKVTRALAELVLDRWGTSAGFTFTEDEKSAAARINHFRLDEAKRHLSSVAAQHGLESRTTHQCQVVYPGRGDGFYATPVSAADLTSISRPVCEAALDVVEKALREAGIGSSEIDEYFMVGGSSKLVLMSDLLTELFGRPPTPMIGPYGVVDPYLAVVRGAAIDDLERSGANSQVPGVTPVLERKLSYPIALVVDRRTRLDVLVPDGAELPFGPVKREYVLEEDGDNVDIIMVRGDDRPEDAAPLAFRRVFFPQRVSGGTEFQISWSIDNSGMITISALDAAGEPLEVFTAPTLEDS